MELPKFAGLSNWQWLYFIDKRKAMEKLEQVQHRSDVCAAPKRRVPTKVPTVT